MKTHNQILKIKFSAASKRVKRRRAAAAVLSAAGATVYLGAHSNADTLRTWQTNGAGTWSGTANWSGSSVPNSNTTVAIFNGNVTSTPAPTLDESVTLDQLQFLNTTAPVTLGVANNSTLTLNGNASTAPNSPTGYGLWAKNTGNSSITIDPSILIAGNQTWYNALKGTAAIVLDGNISTVENASYSVSLQNGPFDLGNQTAVSSNVTLAVLTNAQLNPAAGGSSVVNGPVSLTETGNGTRVTITANATSSLDLTNTISGNAGLSLQGGTTLELDGNNTFTGLAQVQNGTLILTNSGALGNAASPTLTLGAPGTYGAVAKVLTNAAISIANYNFDFTAATTNSNIAGVVLGAEATQIGNSSYGGNLSIGAFSGNFSGSLVQLQAPAIGSSVSFTGNISSPGGYNGGISIVGPGTVILSGSNTYTGNTSVTSGTLQLGSATALPAGGNISFAGGTLQYTANNTVDYSANIVSSASPISIDTNGQSVTFAGSLAGTNSGGLTVNSSTPGGVLTLSASNGYGGATTINGGTVRANASANSLGTGTVIVNSGGTLGGNGTISNGTNPITINSGATITAGQDALTPGTLATGAQSWTAGGRFLAKINDPNISGNVTPGTSTTWDYLNATTLAVTGNGTTTATSFTIAPVGTLTGVAPATIWTIANTSTMQATVNGSTLDGASVATAPNLLTDPSGAFVLDTSNFSVNGQSGSAIAWAFSLELVQSGNGDNLDLIYNGTPEPGVPLLMSAGLAPMLFVRRRRERAAT
jgi:fibronectin-binding autotransporter adhesin